ncbi:hypothetical protein B0H13DRAFT_2400447 [Mycena leptocephala]|nr:hypothetical protein B0H13DRAFT_2400447 [Mycena leptocephala]
MPATPSHQSRAALPHSPYRFNFNNEVVEDPLLPAGPQPAPALPVVAPLPPTSSPSLAPDSRMKQALVALETKSHVIRQGVAAEEQSDKETGATYARQAALLTADPSHITTGPQKRKRDDGSESTGTISISGVKQVISALEDWHHHHQHEYPDVPAAQIGLHHDLRIKTFETAAVHKEPQRVKMAHTLKAKGTNAYTFTAADLIKCAGWCLTDFKSPFNIYMGLRDRTMLLTSCSVAFRGDNTRSLLLSDLFMMDVMMNTKSLGETVPANAYYAGGQC